MKTNRLIVRDYINIAIFTVIMFIVSNVSGLLTAFSATFSFVIGSSVSAFFTAIVFQVLIFKIPKKNVFFISILLQSLVYIMMGFPQMLLTTLPGAVVGEGILRWQKEGRTLWNSALAWSAYSAFYSLHGAVMLWVFGGPYLTENYPDMFSADQVTLLSSLYYNPLWIIVMVGSSFILGGLGCFVWWGLFKRHFIKSGMVKLSQKQVK